MSRIPPALAVILIPLALASCSGHRSAPTSASVPPPSPPPSAGPTTPTTPTTPRTATPTDVPPDDPPRTPTADPVQLQVQELSTGGGVASLVIRLAGAGTEPAPRETVLEVGRTLRLVVISPAPAHLTGAGLGVDIDIPAGAPTAVDVVSFTPGSYAVKTGRGTVVLKVTVPRPSQ